MKILVTGFEPFGGETKNPALEVVRCLPKSIEGAEIVCLEVPVTFHQSAAVLAESLASLKPDAVLCIGQAGGRFGLTPERVAINQDDASIPDNSGQQPIDLPIQADGQPAYFSSLPIKAMVAAIREAGLPASVSNTAGTYVCNHLMYQALYQADKFYPGLRAGFLHIPFLPEQVVDKPNTPSMGLADICRGVEIALATIVLQTGQADQKLVGGATH